MHIEKYYPEMQKHFEDWCKQNDVKYTEVTLDDTIFTGYTTDKYNIEQLNISVVKYVLNNTNIVLLDDLRLLANMLHIVFVDNIPNSKERRVCFTGIVVGRK